MNKDKMKQLLWAANKYRGRMTQGDIIKAMIFALFLKFLEGKKGTIFDEKYSVTYLSLTYGKVITDEEITDYIIKTELEYGFNEGIISSGFSEMLNNSEEETIRNVFDIMKSLDTDINNEYSELAFYLLNQLYSVSGRSNGIFITNYSLSVLIKKLLNCKDEMSLYDGASGYGMLVNTVADDKCRIYAQDVMRSAVSITAVMALLAGNKIGAIKCGDSLLNPIDNNTKFDRVIIDPPMMPRYDAEYIKNIPKDNYYDVGIDDKDSIFVRHAIARLKDDGVAAVIVPMGLLFRSGRGGLAREVYASNYVEAVIELPSGILSGTAVATAVLILRKKERFEGILMINAKSFCEKTDRGYIDISANGIDEIVRIYNNRGIIEGISNVVTQEKLLKNEYNMCTAPYVSTKRIRYTEEDVIQYVDKYEKLSAQVNNINRELDTVRKNFYR